MSPTTPTATTSSVLTSRHCVNSSNPHRRSQPRCLSHFKSTNYKITIVRIYVSDSKVHLLVAAILRHVRVVSPCILSAQLSKSVTPERRLHTPPRSESNVTWTLKPIAVFACNVPCTDADIWSKSMSSHSEE